MKIPLGEIEAVEKLPGRYSKIKIEQVLGMLKILERIQEEPALRERLALKGGSAINFFLLEKMGRLSVDLDLDYIAPRETLKEAMNASVDHKRLFEKIARDLKVNVVKYIPPRAGKRIATITFSFESSIAGEVFVDCDLAYYQRQTIFGEARKPFIGFGRGVELFKNLSALIVNPADVWGSKLVALVWMEESDIFPKEFVKPDEVRYRHLYDAYQLSQLRQKGKISDIDFNRIRTAFTVWGPPRDSRFPVRRGEIINKIEFEDPQTNLFDFLPATKRPDFEEMRDEVLENILTPMYQRDRSANLYVREFVKGNYNPEYIFGEMDYSLISKMKYCSYLKDIARIYQRRRRDQT